MDTEKESVRKEDSPDPPACKAPSFSLTDSLQQFASDRARNQEAAQKTEIPPESSPEAQNRIQAVQKKPVKKGKKRRISRTPSAQAIETLGPLPKSEAIDPKEAEKAEKEKSKKARSIFASVFSGNEAPATEQETISLSEEDLEGEDEITRTRAQLILLGSKEKDVAGPQPLPASQAPSWQSAQEEEQSSTEGVSLAEMGESLLKGYEQAVAAHPWALWLRPGFYALLVALLMIVWYTWDMIRVGFLETSQVAGILGLGLFAAGLAGFFFFLQKKNLGKVLAWLLCLAVAWFSLAGIHNNAELIEDLNKATRQDTIVTDAAGIYYLSQAPVNSLTSLQGLNVGMLTRKNKTYNERVLRSLTEMGIHVKARSFDTYEQMMRSLKGQAIRAVILTPSDLQLGSEIEGLKTMKSELGQLETFPSEAGLQDLPENVDVAQEPFTVLVSASMDPLDQESYRSWLTMLVTINPKTHTILSIFIPRNTRLFYACPEGLACNAGIEDKISLAGFSSILTLKQTLEDALGMEINYTVRIDMKDMLEFVEKAGKITVDNDQSYTSGTYEFNKGLIEMNEVQARRYAQDLDDYSDKDLIYQHNMENLLLAIVESAAKDPQHEAAAVAEMMAQSVHTTFSYEELVTLLRMFCLHHYPWQVYSLELQGANGMEYSHALSGSAFMTFPAASSLAAARGDIEAVLAGEQPQNGVLKEAQEDSQE